MAKRLRLLILPGRDFEVGFDEVRIDEDLAEKVYQEMLAEALERHRFHGLSRLQFEIKLRNAVWRGARRAEEEKLLKKER